MEKVVRRDERRIGYKSVAGTRAMRREGGGREGRKEGRGEPGASVCMLISQDVAVGRDTAEGYGFVSRVEAG